MKITKIITADGSTTFHNSLVDETYHSSSGALDEALRKHVLPCNIDFLAKKNKEIIIGDICFGLGYNSLVAISKIKELNPNCDIQVFAFENDYDILNEIPNLDLPKEHSFAHSALSSLVSKDSIVEKNETYSIHIYSIDNLTLTLYVGDVLDCLPKLSDCVLDVVFFDPFSPKKHSALWSQEMFSSAYRVLNDGGRLSTYSCARVVRDNLKSAGFEVIDGPSVGRRAPSTIAIKD